MMTQSRSDQTLQNEQIIRPGFRGRYDHTIDPKNRLSLPARYRKIFENVYSNRHVYLTTDNKKNLYVYPIDVWATLEDELLSLSTYDADTKDQIFIFSYFGLECSLDSAGRLLIPKQFRESAELSDNVVIIGKINHFEIWDRDEARKHVASLLEKKDSETRLAEIGEKVKSIRMPRQLP